MTEHTALARRLYDAAFTRGDLDAIDQLLAADAVDHEEFPGATGDARADLKTFVQQMHVAFADFRVDVEDVISEGDRVAARITMRGTHRAPFLGIEPAGGTLAWPIIDIMRFEDGRMVEHWGAGDSAILLAQLNPEA